MVILFYISARPHNGRRRGGRRDRKTWPRLISTSPVTGLCGDGRRWLVGTATSAKCAAMLRRPGSRAPTACMTLRTARWCPARSIGETNTSKALAAWPEWLIFVLFFSRPRRTRALSRLSRSGTQDEHRPSLLSTLLASEESPVAGQNTHALVAKETGIRGIGARQYSISDRSLSLRGTGLQSTDGSPMADEGDNSNAFAAALDAESIPPDESSLNYIGRLVPAGR